MHLESEEADLGQAHDDYRKGYELDKAKEAFEEKELVRVLHLRLSEPKLATSLFNLHLKVVVE